MTYQKVLVSLVAIFALAISLIASVSASSISVEVSGVQATNLAVFAGQTLPVRVVFSSDISASDVRVKAWISGEQALAVSTDRFNVVAGKTYSRLVSIQVPSNIDPTEDLTLNVLVENRENGTIVERTVSLSAQRDSYVVEILDANMNSEVKAGSSLPIDIVLKNRGMQLAEDTFVRAKIAALGIEQKAFFGDLSPLDQTNPDREDAVQKRIVLNIPFNAPVGIYLVELQVYNADSVATTTQKVSVVSGASENTVFISTANSKTFAVGDKAVYSLTLVNSEDKVRVYQLSAETPVSLAASLDESVIVVPAGSSKTVNFGVTASKEGTSNATLVLTIVLAIIFVVLLVVLIVLLTRKPETKAEEFGESYY